MRKQDLACSIEISAIRQTQAKCCSKCGVEKSLNEFPDEVKRKDGKYPWCKPCLSIHRKVRYKAVLRKIWLTQKVCSKCKIWKPREAFRKYTGNNLHYRCIDCEDKLKENTANGLSECSCCKKVKPLIDFYKSKTSQQCIDCHQSYHKQPNVKLRVRDNNLQKYFGISLEQYKNQLVIQEFKCPICLGAFEENNYSYPVDHAHNGPFEGRIRAILHDTCNRFVMARHNDPELLRRAADLMESPLTNWFVPEEFVKSRKKKRRWRRK